MIDQVSGSLGHPAAAATWTKRAALAGKRDQAVEAAVAAAKPREPAGEPATLKKIPELLLDEAGQTFPLAQTGSLRAKGLQVIVHDLVERTLRGIPRFEARRGCGHSRPEGGRRASEEPDEIGLNARARERHVADLAVLRRWRDRRSCPRGTTRFLHAANVSLLEEPWRRGFGACDRCTPWRSRCRVSTCVFRIPACSGGRRSGRPQRRHLAGRARVRRHVALHIRSGRTRSIRSGRLIPRGSRSGPIARATIQHVPERSNGAGDDERVFKSGGGDKKSKMASRRRDGGATT